jgi:hypothetical protein
MLGKTNDKEEEFKCRAERIYIREAGANQVVAVWLRGLSDRAPEVHVRDVPVPSTSVSLTRIADQNLWH